MRIGYGRVSSYGQSLEIQMEQLTKAGCERIFSEKLSGTSTAKRLQLKECISFCREGDTLVITRLDRLARSIGDLRVILKELESKNVKFIALEQNVDTTTSSGRLLLNMLGCIAEFETDLRRERQTEGIAKALDKGVHFGKKKLLSSEQIKGLKSERKAGIKIRELMEKYNLSKESIYRYLRAEEK
ncbi:MAG TPA: resolvase [Lentisphaeria bacterium]|nr:MAG: resolvase [Lentisphaerae bacterium GWF2_38_69]HBM15785.1 resolvase [Lentisphaeria bacterium]